MKNAASFDNLKLQAERSGKSYADSLREWIGCNYPQQGAFRDDNWFVREVPLGACYFAHTDFRGYLVTKNQRFIDFMADKRQEIDSGTFPCSSEIRGPWSGPMPEPLVQEREPEKYYVLDGQLRVIRHWYHNVPIVRAFVYRGHCDV